MIATRSRFPGARPRCGGPGATSSSSPTRASSITRCRRRRRWKDKASTRDIDLRTLNPLDFDTIREHVERCGKAKVVSEGVLTSGVAAEFARRISEECFDYLEESRGPRRRRGHPISVSTALEAGSLPGQSLIAEVAERLVA